MPRQVRNQKVHHKEDEKIGEGEFFVVLAKYDFAPKSAWRRNTKGRTKNKRRTKVERSKEERKREGDEFERRTKQARKKVDRKKEARTTTEEGRRT